MITIICAGSRGDFQPYIALAVELKKLGKAVRIAGFHEFEDFVRGYGVDYAPIEADYEKLGVDPELLKQAQSADNPLKMLFAFNKMKKYGVMVADKTYAALEGSDLIVYHPGSTIGYFAAQEMGIPSVLATPFPMHGTNEYLSVVTYGKAKPTVFNKKLSYRMVQGMLWLASSSTVKGYWKTKFGRLPNRFGSPYERISKQHPALVSCSNHVFPRPRDWNENIHQSGYWFVEEPKEYTPPKALEDFLAAGEKPVYIGFGSVFHSDQKDAFIKLIGEAMKKRGKRAVISGMGEIPGLPDNLLAIGSTPHSWLFPRVSAVCHHGGAGTTAAGFQAGIPSVIVPFSNDQFAWAHRAYDLGVGSAPVYKKNLTADRLAHAIEEALQENVIMRAKKLAQNIAKENGAADCAKIIESMLVR